jgi:hypothetical protein
MKLAPRHPRGAFRRKVSVKDEVIQSVLAVDEDCPIGETKRKGYAAGRMPADGVSAVSISPTSTIKLLQLLGGLGTVRVQFDRLLKKELRLPQLPASPIEISRPKRDIRIHRASSRASQ